MIGPKDAFRNICGILDGYIQVNMNNHQSWRDAAIAARNQLFLRYPDPQNASLDEMKVYVTDTLAKTFTSVLAPFSTLKLSLLNEANSWPTQLNYLAYENARLLQDLTNEKELNTNLNTRLEAAELDKLTLQGSLTTALQQNRDHIAKIALLQKQLASPQPAISVAVTEHPLTAPAATFLPLATAPQTAANTTTTTQLTALSFESKPTFR